MTWNFVYIFFHYISYQDYPTILFQRSSPISGHQIYPQLIKQRSNSQISSQQLAQQLSQQLSSQQLSQQLSSHQLSQLSTQVSAQMNHQLNSAVVTASLDDIYPKLQVGAGGRLVQVLSQDQVEEVYPKVQVGAGGRLVQVFSDQGDDIYPKLVKSGGQTSSGTKIIRK